MIDRACGLIAITPTALGYVSMSVDDLMVIDLYGVVVERRWKLTVETPLYTFLCRRREDVGCGVHYQAPHVSCLAAAVRPIPMVLAEAARCLNPEVPLAQCMPSGMAGFAELMLEVIGVGCAAMAGQHGVAVWGQCAASIRNHARRRAECTCIPAGPARWASSQLRSYPTRAGRCTGGGWLTIGRQLQGRLLPDRS